MRLTSTTKRPSSLYIWICVAIILGSAWISLPQMQDGLYPDERITISHIGNLIQHATLWDTVDSIQNNSEQHAPAYFWLLNLWVRVAGYSQVALRYLSVLFGFLSIAAVFRVSRIFYGQRSALYATGLFSASALNVYYFHEMRMYTLLTFLTLMLLWQYHRLNRIDYSPTHLDWILLYICVTAIIYTHYFGIFPLLGIGVYHLLFVKKDRRWVQISAGFILAGITFLPWIGVVLDGTREVVNADHTGLSLLALLFNWLWLTANSWFVLMGLTIVGLLLGLRDRRIVLPMIVGVVVCLALFATNEVFQILPLRRSRYYLLLLPYVVMIIGYGLALFPRWRVVMPVIVIAWFVSGYQLHNSDAFQVHTNRAFYEYDDLPPYPEIITELMTDEAIETPDDLVMMVKITNDTESNSPFIAEYYWRLANVKGRVIEARSFNIPVSEVPEGVHNYREVVEYELSLDPFVVYLGYEPEKLSDTNYNQMIDALGGKYQSCEPLEYSDDLYLEVFVLSPLPCDIISPPNVDIGFETQPVRLEQVITEQVDEQLLIVTSWALYDEMPFNKHSYSMRIVDENGDYIAFQDSGIPLALNSFGEADGSFKRDLMAIDTSTWEAGTYELRMVVYQRLDNAIDQLVIEGTDTFEVVLQTFDYMPPSSD